MKQAGERTLRWMVIGAAAAGVALLALSTRWGPGIGGDATIYLSSARNLLDGVGLGLVDAAGRFRLIPYFAPFFPLVLSALGMLGLDLVAAAHGLNLLLFAGLIWLAGDTLLRALKSAGWLALLAALLVLASPVLTPVYSWAMSEPLSNFLGFAGLALLLAFLESNRSFRLLLLAALACGFSLLTRYAAAAFLGAGALALLLMGRGAWRRRLGDALLYGALGSLPMLAWLIYDLSQTETVASRSLETGAGMAARLANFGPLLRPVLLTWLVPTSWVSDPPYPALGNHALLLAAGLALVGGGAWLLWQTRRAAGRLWRWNVLLGLFALVYLAVILVVYVTTYPPITIDSRMTSPVHIAVLLLLPGLLALACQRWQAQRWLPGAAALALVVLVGWYGWRTARIVQQNYETGLGYLAPAWQQSETAAALRHLPPDAVLVSNEVTALLFLTGRRAYPLAEIYQNQPSAVFSRYGDGGDDEGQQAFRQGAYLVLFDTIENQLEPIYAQRSAGRVTALTDGLQLVQRGTDGAIYLYPR